MAIRVPVLAGGDDLRWHSRDPAQHRRTASARPGAGVTVTDIDRVTDAADRALTASPLRKAMTASAFLSPLGSASGSGSSSGLPSGSSSGSVSSPGSPTPGQDLAATLRELGWSELLEEMPSVATPMVFRLLGETGAHAPLI